MKHILRMRLTALVLTILFISVNASSQISIVPKPVKVREGKGHFKVSDKTALLFTAGNAEAMRNARFLAAHLQYSGGPVLSAMGVGKKNRIPGAILLLIDPGLDLPSEGYHLKVTRKNIILEAKTGAGLFYGVQSLIQMFPTELYKQTALEPGRTWNIPAADIEDYPRFPYRGMHLDVSRHFFPKEFVKQYIDLLSTYKMNTFHWHLNDDNGWRIEIKKYPKLMSVSAWRVDREAYPWLERLPQQNFERATYGGYYTQEEIKEVIEYAARRYVTIIPEIEMPAHCIEVLAAYPELSCTGGPFTVPPGSYWPNVDIYCAGNDSVFEFLEDVLTEVIAIFPSKYIHIGGDEATKDRWKECPKCQARIKNEGLKDEKELQSYFIRRIEKFINSQGRQIIGWDEILEGGLAPEATVMSWRGLEGGIAAASQGHDVIMNPTSHCYFDYYQADPAFQPKAIGGYVPLSKVYSFEPVPQELSADKQKHILGAQGNLWTEYIPTPEHAEYMALPRMLALAEVNWTPKELKEWSDFRKRLDPQLERLGFLGINYSKGSYRVDISTGFDKKKNKLMLKLWSEQPDGQIRYMLGGNDPDNASPVYREPVEITGNTYVKAGIFVEGALREKLSGRTIIVHHATGKEVEYLEPYSYRYTAGGDIALTDGLRGNVVHSEGGWQGFHGNDMEVIIDLGKEQAVNSVVATFLQNSKSWIFFPDSVVISLSSDKKKWHSVNDQGNPAPKLTDEPMIKQFTQTYPATQSRYIRVRAKNTGVCPQGHEGAGEKCWMFADEIVVY